MSMPRRVGQGPKLPAERQIPAEFRDIPSRLSADPKTMWEALPEFDTNAPLSSWEDLDEHREYTKLLCREEKCRARYMAEALAYAEASESPATPRNLVLSAANTPRRVRERGWRHPSEHPTPQSFEKIARDCKKKGIALPPRPEGVTSTKESGALSIVEEYVKFGSPIKHRIMGPSWPPPPAKKRETVPVLKFGKPTAKSFDETKQQTLRKRKTYAMEEQCVQERRVRQANDKRPADWTPRVAHLAPGAILGEILKGENNNRDDDHDYGGDDGQQQQQQQQPQYHYDTAAEGGVGERYGSGLDVSITQSHSQSMLSLNPQGTCKSCGQDPFTPEKEALWSNESVTTPPVSPYTVGSSAGGPSTQGQLTPRPGSVSTVRGPRWGKVAYTPKRE